MSRTWGAAPLIAALVMSSAVQAQAPAGATEDGTTVTDVIVVGGKIMPNTEDPKSATCEFLVATDSFLRAQMWVASTGADPFFMGDLGEISQAAPPKADASALLGPTIYLPTRLPLNVDYRSPPLTPVGSALPQIPRQYIGVTSPSANTADKTTATERSDTKGADAQRLYNVDAPAAGVPGEFTIQDAIASCRGYHGVNQGQSEIAYRDKFLPTAMALFEHRRYAESLEQFEQAFRKLTYETGGDEAALMIGKLYLGAPGVERNTRQALMWLDRAAGAKFNAVTDTPRFDPREPTRNTASGEAAMILARLYQTGAAGVGKDAGEAHRWFERALEVGHVPAAVILGDMSYYGAGAPKDVRKAFDYYRKGAILSHAPAQNALADMYLTGEAPGGRDLAKSLAWRTYAARLGNAPAMFALAVAYETGNGVAASPDRALALYKLSALAGDAAAKNAVGTYFYEGRGLAKDPVLARRWFEQGATAGDPDAMFNLGAMMMKGEGGDADRTRAWVWLKLAEKGENPNAAAAVGVLEARMTAEEKAAATRLLVPTTS